MGTSLDLSWVTTIIETRKLFEVNRYLDEGWKLIAVQSGNEQHEFGDSAYVLYSPGWFVDPWRIESNDDQVS